MLIRHSLAKCNLLFSPGKSPIFSSLSSLKFCKTSVSAARAEDDTVNSYHPSNLENTVSQILAYLKRVHPKTIVESCYSRDLFSSLSISQVDQIIEKLGVEKSELAVIFFNLLRNDYGFCHSRPSVFVVSHVLAERKRMKELRTVLMQMVEQEDSQG